MAVDSKSWLGKNQREVEQRLRKLEGFGSSTNFRIKANGTLQLLNTTDSLYHSIWIEDVGGIPTFKIADTGEA